MARTLIKIEDIPPGAKKLINLSLYTKPKDRTIILPSVNSKMYEHYKSWDQSVELTALTQKWIQIINLAHTTKVLLDEEKHTKALEAMLRKAVLCRNFNKDLLFNDYEWNILRQNVKARYFRDEPTRKVVIQIFQHSDGLKRKLGRLTRINEDLEGMGIGREETEYIGTSDCESTEAPENIDEARAVEESNNFQEISNMDALNPASTTNALNEEFSIIEESDYSSEYLSDDDSSADEADEKDDPSEKSQYATPNLCGSSHGDVRLDGQSVLPHDVANRLQALSLKDGVAIEAQEGHIMSQLEKDDSHKGNTLQGQASSTEDKHVASNEASQDDDIYTHAPGVTSPPLEFDPESGLLLYKDYFPDKSLQWTMDLRQFVADAISRGQMEIDDMNLADLLITSETTIDSKLAKPWWGSMHPAVISSRSSADRLNH